MVCILVIYIIYWLVLVSGWIGRILGLNWFDDFGFICFFLGIKDVLLSCVIWVDVYWMF